MKNFNEISQKAQNLPFTVGTLVKLEKELSMKSQTRRMEAMATLMFFRDYCRNLGNPYGFSEVITKIMNEDRSLVFSTAIAVGNAQSAKQKLNLATGKFSFSHGLKKAIDKIQDAGEVNYNYKDNRNYEQYENYVCYHYDDDIFEDRCTRALAYLNERLSR